MSRTTTIKSQTVGPHCLNEHYVTVNAKASTLPKPSVLPVTIIFA